MDVSCECDETIGEVDVVCEGDDGEGSSIVSPSFVMRRRFRPNIESFRSFNTDHMKLLLQLLATSSVMSSSVCIYELIRLLVSSTFSLLKGTLSGDSVDTEEWDGDAGDIEDNACAIFPVATCINLLSTGAEGESV